MRALTLAETAAELGKSKDWLIRNWDILARTQRFPRPIIDGGHPTWSAAQVWAWMDRGLTKEMRSLAAAYRAAEIAARVTLTKDPDETAGIEDQKRELERKFGRTLSRQIDLEEFTS